MSDNQRELKPCPMCGGPAIFEINDSTDTAHGLDSVRVECAGCGVQTEHEFTDNPFNKAECERARDLAAEAWNTRAAQQEALPNEQGKNRYGLDMAYFRNVINRELNRPLIDYRPHELARIFARLSRTADAEVMREPEFATREKAEPLYVRVVSVPHGPGEEFVEIETVAGNSVRVASQSKGRGRLIGPLYTAPQPAKAVPDDVKASVARWRRAQEDYSIHLGERDLDIMARYLSDLIAAAPQPEEPVE